MPAEGRRIQQKRSGGGGENSPNGNKAGSFLAPFALALLYGDLFDSGDLGPVKAKRTGWRQSQEGLEQGANEEPSGGYVTSEQRGFEPSCA